MASKKIIDAFAEKQSKSSMQDLIETARNEKLTNKNIAYLAKKLAESGEIIPKFKNSILADIASTGGPSSLTTVLTPLILRSVGFVVPKLGVKGRPAGAVDILSQIPGYKVNLNTNEVIENLKEVGYTHFLASEKHAPLDALLFDYRSKNEAKKIPDLVIASILSKKIAVNLDYAGLDIRVAPFGNFGKNWKAAKKNAIKFIQTSNILNIKAKCFLTDGRFPFQNYIGRGEALIALSKIFNNDFNHSLRKHYEMCLSMAFSINPYDNFNEPNLKDSFIDNLEAQGSSYSSFNQYIESIKESSHHSIVSPTNGFWSLDLMKLRSALVWGQEQFVSSSNPFPDPCGVTLQKQVNSYIKEGEELLTFRAENSIKKELENKIISSISFSNHITSDIRFEVIKHG